MNVSQALASQDEFDASWSERWIGFLDASQKTIETYSRALKQFIVFLAMHNISKPTRETIIAYRDSLKSMYKPSTAQIYLVAVRLFFRWTSLEGLYQDIADNVKGVKIDRCHKKDYLTTKQLTDLLGSVDRSTLRGKRDYAMLTLMATTGLRTISIIRANVGDIGVIGDFSVLFYQGKGRDDKGEYVKLVAQVEDAIRDYLRCRGDAKANEPLFSAVANRNIGGRMTTRSVSRSVKEHLGDIGLTSERLTAHSLRHTAATLNLLNGGTLEETQQLLGHSSINTTMIYSHALERAKNASEERIAKAIFG